MMFIIKRGVLFFFIVILMAAAIPSATAIGLGGSILSPILYVPGKTITNHYYIADTLLPVQVSVSGELAIYVNVTPIVDNEFDMIIQFPHEFIPAGTHYFSLTAMEKGEATSSGVGAFASVSKRFVVEAYSHDKDITASLSAPSVNENGTVHFTIDVQSRTYSDINSVSAKIIIKDLENITLAEVQTNTAPLPAMAGATLTASFNTTGLRPAQYLAKAQIFYDSKRKTADATFRIGNMDLILRNYTSIFEQGFTTFQALVFNNWGNELRSVYAKLLFGDRELLQTPTIFLGPWEEGQLQGIIKVDLPPGNYNGTLQLFFEGEQKEEPLTFTVVESISPEKVKADVELSRKNMIIQLLAIGVIILIVMVIVLLKGMAGRSKENVKSPRYKDEI